MAMAGPTGPVAGTVAYDSTNRRATFTPSAPLTAGSQHTVTVSAALDLAGNALAAPLVWSFTTAGTAPPPTCPCSLFGPADSPQVPSENDPNAVALGTRFRVDVAGQITGVRFYKGPQNTGVHTGSLWSASGQRLATATFSGESASGWQQVSFATPVAVQPGQDYVVSYFAPRGGYAATAGRFSGTGVDRGPLHAPADGDGGGNGLYIYGADARPTQTWASTNYWVDVVFVPSPLPTPPTVVPGSATIAEGNAGTSTLRIPLTLSAASTQTVTVPWSTIFVNGLAVAQADPGTDYVAGSGVVTFAPWQTSATASITIRGDTTVESDELIVVTFHDPTNAVMGGFWGLGFGGILNDDGAGPGVVLEATEPVPPRAVRRTRERR
jgi:hypothetical protein